MKPYFPDEFDVLPIHMQMRDAHLETLLAQQLGAVDAHAYGVVEMFVDEGALSDGHLAFRSLQAIMPSKLPVLEVQPRRDVLKAWPRAAAALDLFLAVPGLAARGPNVRPRGGRVRMARYEEVGTVEYPLLRPSAELLLEHEPREHVESIFLGRVRREGMGLALEPDVLPTLARFHAAESWRPRLGRFIGALQQRQQELLHDRENHPLHLDAVEWEQIPPLRLLLLLNGDLPALTEFYLRPAARPRDLYVALNRFYGCLRSFGATATMPAYSHERPAEALSALFDGIQTTVQAAARDTTIRVPFVREESKDVGVIHRAPFVLKDVEGRRPYLVAECDVEELLLNDLPPVIRIASPAQMRDRQVRSVLGVRVSVVFSVPANIPSRTGVIAYTFDERSEDWDDILKEQEVQIDWRPQTTPYWQRFSQWTHHPSPRTPPEVTFTLYWVDDAR